MVNNLTENWLKSELYAKANHDTKSTKSIKKKDEFCKILLSSTPLSNDSLGNIVVEAICKILSSNDLINCYKYRCNNENIYIKQKRKKNNKNKKCSKKRLAKDDDIFYEDDDDDIDDIYLLLIMISLLLIIFNNSLGNYWLIYGYI